MKTNLIELKIGDRVKTFEAMTVEQYNSAASTAPFNIEGPGKGRRYYSTFTYYVSENGNLDQLHPYSIIYVSLD